MTWFVLHLTGAMVAVSIVVTTCWVLLPVAGAS